MIPGAGSRARYIGWLSTDNVGDLALYQSVRRTFGSVVIDASARDYDAAVIGGGTLIFRSGSLEEARAAVDRCTSRTFVFGTGVADPEFDEILQPGEWQKVLEKCFFIGVRGPRSLEVLRDHGFAAPAEVIGDPALLLGQGQHGSASSDRIVINILEARHSRLWGWNNETVLDSVTEAARHLLRQGWSLSFVSFESRDDRFIERAISGIGDTNGIDFVRGYLDLQRTLELLSKAHLVIAEKLHAAILAAAVGTPFVSLEYRPKCRDFALGLGVENLVLRTDQTTGEAIIEKVEYLLSDYPTVRQKIESGVASHRQRLVETAEMIQRRLLQRL